MNAAIEEKLIDLFWDGLRGYTSDVWFDSSTNEKEEILWQALEQINEPVDKEQAIQLFWDWADGIEEDAFYAFDSLTEDLNKIVDNNIKSLSEDFKEWSDMWETNTQAAKKPVNLQESRNLKESANDEAIPSSYHVWVSGSSNKEIKNQNVPDEQALKEILAFINGLTRDEKFKVGCGWNWLDDDGEESDVVVSIYDPEEGEAYEDRTMGNWPYAEKEIRKALGLKDLF